MVRCIQDSHTREEKTKEGEEIVPKEQWLNCWINPIFRVHTPTIKQWSTRFTRGIFNFKYIFDKIIYVHLEHSSSPECCRAIHWFRYRIDFNKPIKYIPARLNVNILHSRRKYRARTRLLHARQYWFDWVAHHSAYFHWKRLCLAITENAWQYVGNDWKTVFRWNHTLLENNNNQHIKTNWFTRCYASIVADLIPKTKYNFEISGADKQRMGKDTRRRKHKLEPAEFEAKQ